MSIVQQEPRYTVVEQGEDGYAIRDWQIQLGDYWDAPLIPGATYFVDARWRWASTGFRWRLRSVRWGSIDRLPCVNSARQSRQRIPSGSDVR